MNILNALDSIFDQRGSCIVASLVQKSKDSMACGCHPSCGRLAAKEGEKVV